MYPDLISLGFLHIKTYGAFMALGFIAAWQVLSWLCRRTGRNPEPCTNLIMFMMISGVVGARIAYVVEHWSQEFAGHLDMIPRVDKGGLMFYGGLILAIVVFFAWCRAKRERMLPMADLFAVVIPLGHAFGRVGCFFYGCCFGRLSGASCAVAFPRGSPAWHEQLNVGLITPDARAALPVLPTQLIEAVAVFFLFVALLMVHRRFWKERPGFVTGYYLICYACIRYGIEILRGDPRASVGVFTISQAISLALILFGSAFILVAFRRGKL
jgi:phosphatidylglycerol:prolipoprotein diacylglycerol transferase